MKINFYKTKLIRRVYLNHLKMLWAQKAYLFRIKKLMIDFRGKNKGSNRDQIKEKINKFQILMIW